MTRFLLTNIFVMLLWFCIYCNARETTFLASFGCLLSGIGVSWCICNNGETNV